MRDRLSAHFTVPDAWRGVTGPYRSPLMRADGTSVETAAEWPAQRAALLRRWRRDLGRWPRRPARPALRVLGQERAAGFTRRRVEVRVAPGRTLGGYLLMPDGDGPFPAVLDVFYTPEGGAGLDPAARGRHDFGYQAAQRGFAALCVGTDPWPFDAPPYYPSRERAQLQPLGYLAHAADVCREALAAWPGVDGARIGIVGHSYGGKWALFAACLFEGFACAAVSDPGIVFDEARPNVNYWEPWYLGWEPGPARTPGPVAAENPRTGLYRRLVDEGRDLHELHALMAPRPLLVSGGSEDTPERWAVLNHLAQVNALLGHVDRVGMHNRTGHDPTPASNEVVYDYLTWWLRPGA